MTDDALRSRLFSDILQQNEDKAQRRIIEGFSDTLNFDPIDTLLISPSAWDHVCALGVAPKVVFAHPDLLSAHPTTSLYYRGLTEPAGAAPFRAFTACNCGSCGKMAYCEAGFSTEPYCMLKEN